MMNKRTSSSGNRRQRGVVLFVEVGPSAASTSSGM